MKVFFYPIIPLTIIFCLGIISYSQWNDYDIIFKTSTLITFVSIILLLFLKKFKKITQILLAFLWFLLGYGISKFHDEKNLKTHYTNNIELESVNNIQLVLEEKLKSSEKFDKYYAQIIAINNIKTKGKTLVYIKKNDSILIKISDVIFANTSLHELQQPKNPNEFSYAKYLNKQYIYHQIYLTDNFKIIGSIKDFNYRINKLRESLINSFKIHQFETETQQFINAFIFGQRHDVSENLTEDYRQAGVLHILAISGLHIAILYSLILYVFKVIKWGYKKRFLKLIISLAFLWTFAFVTGMSASVVRSVTMFSVMAIALTFDRNQNIYNSIALSALIILSLKPNFIFDVGFQLSYLAVLIIVICNPLYKKLHFTKYKILHASIDVISISFTAQIFLLPLLLYYFNQFPTLFLIANLIVIPLSNAILYGLVFVLLLNFILPNLAIYFGYILAFAIEYLNKYIAWIASFESFNIKNIPFNFTLFLASYFIIIILLLNIFYSNKKRFFYLVFSILFFQICVIYSLENRKISKEFIVWNQYKNSVLSLEENDKITIFTNDSLQVIRIFNNLKKDKFGKKIEIKNITNFYNFNSKKIIFINSNKLIDLSINPDIIILGQSPKINLDRIIEKYKPKTIIADASNYKSYIDRWKNSCLKKNIPFHTTYEMGYYSID